MNITKELQHYQSHGEEAVISILNEKKENIEKKTHLIQVVSILDQIQKMIDENTFKDVGVHFVTIKNFRDYDIGYIINFDILDKQKNVVDTYRIDVNYIPIYDKLNELFEKITLDSFSNNNFKEKDELTFPVDNELPQKLRSIFLNTELNASLTHSLLDNALDNKESKSKSLKI